MGWVAPLYLSFALFRSLLSLAATSRQPHQCHELLPSCCLIYLSDHPMSFGIILLHTTLHVVLVWPHDAQVPSAPAGGDGLEFQDFSHHEADGGGGGDGSDAVDPGVHAALAPAITMTNVEG